MLGVACTAVAPTDRSSSGMASVTATSDGGVEPPLVPKTGFVFGPPEVLAANQQFPVDLALDAERVYWGTRSSQGLGPEAEGGAVMAAPKDGRGRPSVVVGRQRGASGLAVDERNLYWGTLPGGSLRVAPVEGGPSRTLLATTMGIADLAVGKSHVYVTAPDDEQVIAVAKSDGESRIVADRTLATRIAIWDASLYFIVPGVGQSEQGVIQRWPLRAFGERPEVIADKQAEPSHMAFTESHIYWTNPADGTVRRAELDGQNEQIVVRGQEYPWGIAIDQAYLYVTNRHGRPDSENPDCVRPDGTLRAFSRSGGSPITLADGLRCPSTILTDDSGVYWVNNGHETDLNDGSVMRVRKSVP